MEEKKGRKKWRTGDQKVGTEEMCPPDKHSFIHKGCKYVSGGRWENSYQCVNCGYMVNM